LGFLGIRTVIERRILNKPHPGYKVQLDLEPASKDLTPLEQVIWAASGKITTGPAVHAVVKQMSKKADYASDWNRFDELIAAVKPTLILLMPHVWEEGGGGQQFEISNVFQEAAGRLESKRAGEALRDHTRVPDGPHPLVLLLGCSTAKLETPFLSPVTAARAGGAAITIATLAPIHESHATAIAELILKLLRQVTDRPAGQRCSFGEFMTTVRCAALSQGYYDALGLITDGDADWYIPSQGEAVHV
jgi:hypothetical protein